MRERLNDAAPRKQVMLALTYLGAALAAGLLVYRNRSAGSPDPYRCKIVSYTMLWAGR